MINIWLKCFMGNKSIFFTRKAQKQAIKCLYSQRGNNLNVQTTGKILYKLIQKELNKY